MFSFSAASSFLGASLGPQQSPQHSSFAGVEDRRWADQLSTEALRRKANFLLAEPSIQNRAGKCPFAVLTIYPFASPAGTHQYVPLVSCHLRASSPSEGGAKFRCPFKKFPTSIVPLPGNHGLHTCQLGVLP